MADSFIWFYILLAAIAYTSFTVLLNKKLGIRSRQKFLQKEVNDYHKELSEAMKSGDDTKQKALAMRDKQVHGYMMEMMMLPWKSFVFIIPVFFLLIGTNGFLGLDFHGLLPNAFPTFEIILPFDLHLTSFWPLENLFALKILQPALYGPRGF